jgi:hypothetical protein
VFELPEFLDAPPAGWDLEEWGALSAGERLRWAKRNQLALSLSREEYLALARQPFWACYGPEHGLPAELFNDKGLLLPKYRPGGGLYPQFQVWRRWYRHVSWSHRAMDRKLERFDYDHGGIVLVVVGMVFIIAAEIASPALQRALPSIAEKVLVYGAGILGTLLVLVLFNLGLFLYSRCMTRGIIRRFPVPEDLHDEAG